MTVEWIKHFLWAVLYKSSTTMFNNVDFLDRVSCKKKNGYFKYVKLIASHSTSYLIYATYGLFALEYYSVPEKLIRF